MSDTNEMMHKEYEFAVRGSDDGDIEHSDNEIEMEGLDGLEVTETGNIMPQKGRSVLHDSHSGIVLASGRLLSVNIIILDHKKKMMNSAIDGDIGYFGNEIDTTGLDARIKDENERKTKVLKALQHLSNQGKILRERKSTQENHIMNETIVEMTLRL